jgi:hypothetical protein
MDGDRVEVRNCLWLHEAQFLKSVLDVAAIEAVIPNEHTLGVQPLYANMLGGARVLVRADDLERATELLDSQVGLPGDSGQLPGAHLERPLEPFDA